MKIITKIVGALILIGLFWVVSASVWGAANEVDLIHSMFHPALLRELWEVAKMIIFAFVALAFFLLGGYLLFS